MARRPINSTATIKPVTPRGAPLPGMEDHAIKALEDVAAQYAEIRDERMELTRREHETKTLALKLMKKYDKTIYRHDGIEITVVPGEDDVKVKVRKLEDDDDDEAAVVDTRRRAAGDTEDQHE
jgi:hypothetical protein